jgi:hypothetical protein
VHGAVPFVDFIENDRGRFFGHGFIPLAIMRAVELALDTAAIR